MSRRDTEREEVQDREKGQALGDWESKWKGGVEWERRETERGRERENKPHQWAGHTALPNCLKKKPPLFYL